MNENVPVEYGDGTPMSVVSNSFDLVDVEGAKAFMENYQKLLQSVTTAKDYQKIGKKQFPKKSAWRKIASAFNITDTIINEEIIRDEQQHIVSAKYYVRATLPNGRSSVGVGVCSIFDKRKKDDREGISNWVLRGRFSNAEHDIPTTAHTRAKNRAISDLVGAGEVSAEELGDIIPETPTKKVTPKKKVAKKGKKVKPKQKKSEEEAIEVEGEVVEAEIVGDSDKKPTKSLKDLMEEDKNIKKAIETLRDESRPVNKNLIREYLLNQVEVGVLPQEEYEKAVELME